MGVVDQQISDVEKAILHEHKIIENDIIILGTDGLWDNLDFNSILEIAINEMTIKEKVELIVEKCIFGDKRDDITVIMCII